jgi:hypothetical protein
MRTVSWHLVVEADIISQCEMFASVMGPDVCRPNYR